MTLSVGTLIKFCVVGASNTLLGLSVIYLAWNTFGIEDTLANMLGYLAGLLWGYVWNKSWTFRAAGKAASSFWPYISVCIIAYGINLTIMSMSRNLLGPQSFLPHILGIFAYTTLSYVGICIFVFFKK